MWKKPAREGIRVLGLMALLLPAAITGVDAQPEVPAPVPTPVSVSVSISSAAHPSPHQIEPGAIGAGQVVPVFFMPGSAKLDPAAERIAARIAEIALSGNAGHLTVTGYFSPDTEDRALARRRIDVLRSRLTAHGVAAERIRTEDPGPRASFSDPTPFSPLQRRAEIALR